MKNWLAVLAKYTSKEFAAEIGIPSRLLLSWGEKNWLTPSIREAEGPGSRRLWSENDLRRGKLIKRLIPFLHPEMVREITTEFKND
ncbi:hypothetical protein CMI37_38605 [Candidatus Pacearchaeota archaeon]|nr:hypothetical protein [Candidatus Pacearchaeota archaeon]